MLKLAGVTKDDLVYDLGSGDGRIVIAAARDFGARGIGVEIDPKLITASVESADKAGVHERVRFVQQDVLETDVGQATVVALYMLPEVNKQLLPRFFNQLRPGTRVVSHRFEIGDWKPDMTLKAYGTTVYLWVIPAPVQGDWRVRLTNEKGTREYALKLQQKYQEISGTVKDGDRNLNVASMRLDGRDITISVADAIAGRRFQMDLEGTVQGDRIQGTALVTSPESPLPAIYSAIGERLSR
jgi:SAM-dependent methyltransferase